MIITNFYSYNLQTYEIDIKAFVRNPREKSHKRRTVGNRNNNTCTKNSFWLSKGRSKENINQNVKGFFYSFINSKIQGFS